MTTYSPAAPSPRFGHLTAHLGTYVAGVGATAALTAGALVTFLSVATFVAFSGLPFGGSSDDAGQRLPRIRPQRRANGGGGRPRRGRRGRGRRSGRRLGVARAPGQRPRARLRRLRSRRR